MQAVFVKKYFGGAFSCKICHKKDSLSTLGYAPASGVQDAPGKRETVSHNVSGRKPLSFRRERYNMGLPPPDATKGLKDGLEVLPFIAGEGSGNVFPNGESGPNKLICSSVCNVFLPHFHNDSDGFKEKAGTSAVVDARLLSGDGQILARRAECDNIDRFQILAGDCCDAANVTHVRKMVAGDGDRIGFDF